MSVTWAADPPPVAHRPPVVWLDWDHYLAWLAGKIHHATTEWGERVALGPPWNPGEHWALDGPTGEGKTTHGVGILGLRKWVLALDAKGEDDTLDASGYWRVGSIYQDSVRWRIAHRDDARTWDQVHKAIERGRPARLIVGGAANSAEQDAALMSLMDEAIVYCRHAGGWTVYADEFELISSQRMFNQGPKIERMLNTARARGTSVVTGFQAPAWISKHATRQARRATKWPTGSRAMIKTLAEDMGRNWRELTEAVDLLPPFHTITMPRGKAHPMVITAAPKL